MILVVVGTQPIGFERLVRAADELATLIDETVIIQYGPSTYQPKYATGFKWVSLAEMQQMMIQARVVISHAGAGTIISAMRLGKPLILVPRLTRFGENHNDHQLQLAYALHAQGKAIVIMNLSGEILKAALETTPRLESPKNGTPTLIEALSQQLQAWSQKSSKA